VASSGAINYEAGGSNEECVVAAGCDFKHQTSPTKDHFKELLEVTDPHHSYTINHKLKDCIMIEKFMTSGAFSKGMKPGATRARKVRHPFLGKWRSLQS
jgi:hypothetical protein